MLLLALLAHLHFLLLLQSLLLQGLLLELESEILSLRLARVLELHAVHFALMADFLLFLKALVEVLQVEAKL